jgi:RND family efflux transporter MFP subunit
VEGRVTRVLVELGHTVHAGQPLFAMTSPQIAQLRTEREQAVVELEAAKVTARRVEATVASRALPVKELQAATQKVKEAELAVQLADQKLASVRVGPGSDHEVVVTAPRAGVVVEKNVLVNQQVSPDAPAALMIVADLSSVWAVADVFEGQTLDIRPGGSAQVTTPSLPGVTLSGKVLMVSSVGDPERHTLPVRVKLANPDGRLRPNVYARVRFAVQHQDAPVEIPATALVSDGEKQYVYVQDSPGHFSRRDIVAGSVHEGRLPVISGLAEGETIVEQGAILLDNQISIVTQ